MNIQFKFLIVSLLVLAALGVACVPTPAPTPITPSPTAISPTVTPAPRTATLVLPEFNFPNGATWTYQGIVKWEEKGKAQQKTLAWKMQIVEKIERGDGVVGYVLKGHPRDLAFYTADKQPGDYLYLARANQVYLVTVRDAKVVDRVKDKNDALADLLADANLAFDFPLTVNKRYGSLSLIARQDVWYVWIVNGAKPTPLTGIQGVTPTNATEYTLELRTNPDRQTVYFVPNVGITRFVYHHNGTLSDVDVKLIEYNPSGTASATPSALCELVTSKELTVYTRPSRGEAL